MPAADVALVTSGTPPVTSAGPSTFNLGPITFGADGSPSLFGTTSFGVTFASTGVSQTVKMNFGSATGALDGVTQFGGTSSAAATGADGSASGTLTSVNVGKDGTINGVYSNGVVSPLASLAIASFTNPSGLSDDGNNLFSVTSQIGAGRCRTVGQPRRRPARRIEQSNVDVAAEFTQLIVAKNSYAMNAKTITVSDQVLQTLANIIQ